MLAEEPAVEIVAGAVAGTEAEIVSEVVEIGLSAVEAAVGTVVEFFGSVGTAVEVVEMVSGKIVVVAAVAVVL